MPHRNFREEEERMQEKIILFFVSLFAYAGVYSCLAKAPAPVPRPITPFKVPDKIKPGVYDYTWGSESGILTLHVEGGYIFDTTSQGGKALYLGSWESGPPLPNRTLKVIEWQLCKDHETGIISPRQEYTYSVLFDLDGNGNVSGLDGRPFGVKASIRPRR